MALHRLIVLTNALDNRDEEFNRWYTDKHLDDVLNTPTFVSAQRFELSGEVKEGDQKWKYLAIYDVETDDVEQSLKDLLDRAGTDAMPLIDCLDLEGAHANFYRPITELVKAKPKA